MNFSLNCGDSLPIFKAKDHQGIVLTNQEILGLCTVLFFYSKDESPSSNLELVQFRDATEEIQKMGVVVMGISPSRLASHQQLYASLRLNFILLSDPKLEMCRAFDVVKEKEGKSWIIPTTFVVDRDGFIRWIERPMHLEGHLQRVLEAVKKYRQ